MGREERGDGRSEAESTSAQPRAIAAAWTVAAARGGYWRRPGVEGRMAARRLPELPGSDAGFGRTRYTQ